MGERRVGTIDAAQTPTPSAGGAGAGYVRDILEALRVLIVAGIPVGVLIAGVGSRLAMFLLRVTSDDVSGIESDDGFTIGEVTLGGTYNLLLLAATIGIIGAAAYQWVRPWLLGPTWFRRLTLALGAGAVVGSMLIHADGVDFTALTPTWLAIGLFIALPAVFGVLIGPAVDSVERPTSWTKRGRWRWALPVVLVAVFPLSLFTLVIAVFVLAIWFAVREMSAAEAIRRANWFGVLVRACWLLIAIVGLLSLVGDVQDITAIT